MSYSVANLKDDLSAILHGQSLNKVANLTALIDRGARDVLADIDPQETKRIVGLPLLYDKAWDYVCPADLKGDRIIDVRPQVRRYPSDKFTQTYNEEFDVYKDWVWLGGITTIQWNTGVRTLRLAKNFKSGAQINGCDSLTANGTWAVGGDAENLSLDTVNFVQGQGSLLFDLDGSGTTGYLENSDMTAVDLTNIAAQGSVFAYTYIPDADLITSFTLRWGSSSSDYWSATVTQTQAATVFQAGWNLLRFDFAGATETGTPDASAVNYLRFTVTYDGTVETDLRLDWIIARLGVAYDIEYYSAYMFRDASTGAFKENTTADSDIVNLEGFSADLLLYRIAYLAAQQIQAQSGTFDVQFFRDEYERLKRQYQAKYKSEVKKPRLQYYRMPNVRRASGYNWGGRSSNW